MNRLIVSLATAFAVSGMIIAGCGQAAPAPAPTKAPEPAKAVATQAPAPAPTKAPATQVPAPAPTKAPAAQAPAATAAPAKKIDYPEKGKTITIIAPWPAGSVNDVLSRLIADYMEKALGTSVQVVDKPGAGSQLGITEVAKAKGDGYTLGLNSMPTTAIVYMDPERQAAFSRKDLLPVAVVVQEPMALSVKGDGPYKTTKDLIDAAKAAPDQIKVADGGFMTPAHIAAINLAKAAGVRIASVHFTGSSESAVAVLGGHTDAYIGSPADALPHFKSGAFRVLGVTDREENKLLPGVRPLPAQGYNVVLLVTRGIAAPGGTPKEIVDLLSDTIKKAAQNEEFAKKVADAGMGIRFLDSAQYGVQWDEQEQQVKALLDEVKTERAKTK